MRALAAQHGQPDVLLLNAEKLTYAVADTAAELERRAFTSRRTARKVSYHRSNKYQRRHSQWDVVFRAYRADYKVRAAVVIEAENVVDQRYERASGGQREDDPAVLTAEFGSCVLRHVEERSDISADHARDRRDDCPSKKYEHIMSRRLRLCYQSAFQPSGKHFSSPFRS